MKTSTRRHADGHLFGERCASLVALVGPYAPPHAQGADGTGDERGVVRRLGRLGGAPIQVWT